MKRGWGLAVAVVLVASFGSNAFAQTTNPAYLADFPSVDKVMTTMKTADPDETAARQMAAFTWLQQMILQLAGPRQFVRGPGGLTADENKLRQEYSTALYNIVKSNPKYNDYTTAMHGLHASLPFRNELIQKAFPPDFLGAKGIEQIIEIKLTPEEQAAFNKSAAAVKELVTVINV
jgi:hypothetical protein